MVPSAVPQVIRHAPLAGHINYCLLKLLQWFSSELSGRGEQATAAALILALRVQDQHPVSAAPA